MEVTYPAADLGLAAGPRGLELFEGSGFQVKLSDEFALKNNQITTGF
jgi:hypothetical protein